MPGDKSTVRWPLPSSTHIYICTPCPVRVSAKVPGALTCLSLDSAAACEVPQRLCDDEAKAAERMLTTHGDGCEHEVSFELNFLFVQSLVGPLIKINVLPTSPVMLDHFFIPVIITCLCLREHVCL